MKHALVALLAFSSVTFAQPSSAFREFENSFALLLRVVEAPCPKALKLPNARCYRHGYSDFFDFKEAFFSFTVDPLTVVDNWHVVTVEAGGERGEAFKSSYRTRGGKELIILTFFEGTFLVLQHPSLE